MMANVFAAGRPLLDRLDRIVYATITLISVLIIYDGWVNLRVPDVVGIIVGPIVAMFIAHVFSTGLARHVKLERRMTGREWLETVRFESRFLLLAAPPVALLIVFDLAGASVSTSIHTIIWLEALSLGFWAGLAARAIPHFGSGSTPTLQGEHRKPLLVTSSRVPGTAVRRRGS